MAEEYLDMATASVLTGINQEDLRGAILNNELKWKHLNGEVVTSKRWVKEWQARLWLDGSEKFDPTVRV